MTMDELIDKAAKDTYSELDGISAVDARIAVRNALDLLKSATGLTDADLEALMAKRPCAPARGRRSR